MKLYTTLILAVATCCFAQRSPYLGKSPVGYPAIVIQTTTTQAGDELGNRFGDGDAQGSSTTTDRLPIEALGDRDLVNRISKLPVDSQPYWYLNWKALEKNRKTPQTYPQKENDFINRVLMSM